jgi:hypothetical protein
LNVFREHSVQLVQFPDAARKAVDVERKFPGRRWERRRRQLVDALVASLHRVDNSTRGGDVPLLAYRPPRRWSALPKAVGVGGIRPGVAVVDVKPVTPPMKVV